MAFNPKSFTEGAKPLPVLLLLDVSGSMSGEKIAELNKAVREMIADFKHEAQMETEINLSIITFGGDAAELQLPFTPVSRIEMVDMEANGMTPMGDALRQAKAMIEDREQTPSRAYRPLVVLCSDGGPNDNWESAMDDFINNGRSAKCDRMAMAIGTGADDVVLNRFIQGTPNPLFFAKDAAGLHKFFKFVTMSVTTRKNTQNPNQILALPNASQEFGSKKMLEEAGNGYWN